MSRNKPRDEAERREAVLKRVQEAGGTDYTIFELKRYAEDLGRLTLQQLEEMSGSKIIAVIKRGLDEVYRLRPCP